MKVVERFAFSLLAKRQVVRKTSLARCCILCLHHLAVWLSLQFFDLPFQLFNPVLQLGHLKLVLGVPGPHLVQNGLEAAVGQAERLGLTTLRAKYRVA